MKEEISEVVSRERPIAICKHFACKEFTLIELLLVITIISILASLLLPVLKKARNISLSVQCLANLRQIGYGFISYAGDNKEIIPPFLLGTSSTKTYVGDYEKNDKLGSNPGWGGYIYPELGGRGKWKVYVCPADPHASERDLTDYSPGYGTGASYCMNSSPVGDQTKGLSNISGVTARMVRFPELKWPSETCLIADDTLNTSSDVCSGRPNGYLYKPWYDPNYLPQHGNGLNVLFCDGHAAQVSLTPYFITAVVIFVFSSTNNKTFSLLFSLLFSTVDCELGFVSAS